MSNLAVCLDASIVVDRLLRPRDPYLGRYWNEWKAEGRPLIAPQLLYYEVTNVIYQKLKTSQITLEETQKILRLLMVLPIHLSTQANLHERALRLANELQLDATYDAHYLALAWLEGAELYTRDARFVRRAQQKYELVQLV